MFSSLALQDHESSSYRQVFQGPNLLLGSFSELIALNASTIHLRGGNHVYPFARIIAEGRDNIIVIGKNTRIQRRSEIHGDVVIGSDSIIASDVFISSGTHLFDYEQELTINQQDDLFVKRNGTFLSKPVRIGSDVWIGRLSTVMPGVTIGDRSIVGANSVVTRSIPEGEVWAGAPCRFIRKR